MLWGKDVVISAQVILPSASGKVVDGETVITAENISDYVPSPDTVAKASEAFTQLGFHVGQMVGISFSITALASTFEEVFAVQLCQEANGGIMALEEDGSATYEIPLRALPESVSALVISVTFTPPPDFGPTEFLIP